MKNIFPAFRFAKGAVFSCFRGLQRGLCLFSVTGQKLDGAMAPQYKPGFFLQGPSKKETLHQCCFNAGSLSATLDQHWLDNSIGSISPVLAGIICPVQKAQRPFLPTQSSVVFFQAFLTNTRHQPDDRSLLVQYLRRWPDIDPLDRCPFCGESTKQTVPYVWYYFGKFTYSGVPASEVRQIRNERQHRQFTDDPHFLRKTAMEITVHYHFCNKNPPPSRWSDYRTIPANTKSANNAVWMLAQRLRHWPNIKTSFFQRAVFAGIDPPARVGGPNPERGWSRDSGLDLAAVT